MIRYIPLVGGPLDGDEVARHLAPRRGNCGVWELPGGKAALYQRLPTQHGERLVYVGEMTADQFEQLKRS